MRKVLVLENLINQTKDRRLSATVRDQIFKEFEVLSSLESEELSLKKYLNSRNAKTMQGAEHIFKFQLNSGDRIIYTLGKYLPYVREKDAIVLIACSEHEKQGEVAQKFSFNNIQDYLYASDIVKDMKELGLGDEGFTDDDLIAAVFIISEPDYSRWQTKYVLSGENKTELESDDNEVYLSDEQDEIINSFFEKPSPLLVYGGAGTGKTLIAIHILRNYNKSNSEKLASYFTQSFELREKSRKIFNALADSDNSPYVEFNDINEYCMDYLGLKRANFVDLFQFSAFMESRADLMGLCNKHGISTVDVWTEIRGTIKGAMSNQWTHTKEFLTQCDEYGNIEKLVKSGVIIRSNKDSKKFKLSSNWNSTILQYPDLSNDKYFKKIKCYYDSFDSNKRTLEKDEYFNLSEEKSTLSIEKREAVWKICESYENYLKTANKFDDNDLIREMFRKELPNYDLIVVDEVQDYTELQIYFLFSIVKDKNKIVFVGDNHQNINPTYFNISKISSLFVNSDLKLVQKSLKMNFRCQSEIISRTNAIAALRRATIASTSSDTEQPETSQKKSASIPMRLIYSEDNLKNIIKEVTNYPGVAILVPNEIEKEKTINIIGKELYESQGVRFIHTVSEIKGMEYSYVVALNLINQYADVWTEMLTTKIAKRQTKYRYYFNLLYVAMTRAQSHLCFIDEKTNDILDNTLKLDFQSLFDAKEMHFTELINSFEKWIDYAKKCETNGQYEDAIFAYKRGNAGVVDIYRCSMLLSDKNHDYESAMKYCILADSRPYGNRIYKEVPEGNIRELGALYLSLVDGVYPRTENGPAYLVNKVFIDRNKRAIAFHNLINLYKTNLSLSSQKMKELIGEENG